jgi:hypothetical protein
MGCYCLFAKRGDVGMAEPIKFFAKHNMVAIPAIPAIRESESRQDGACGDNASLLFAATRCYSRKIESTNSKESHGIATGVFDNEESQPFDNKENNQVKTHGIAGIAGIAGGMFKSVSCEKLENSNLYGDMAMCGLCQNFTPHHQHGKGTGTCTAGVMPSGIVHWSETQHTCNPFKLKQRTPP